MRRLIVTLIIIIFICPKLAQAELFNPNYLLSDYELTNYKSISLVEIIKFLKDQNGALAEYYTRDIDNQLKHAGEIIYNASLRYGINPQALITLVQKEQTLVTQPVVKESQYDWATGFACYDYRRPVSRFSGFTTQVDRTAWRLRYFLEHPWEFYYRPNQAYRISGRLVRPQNLATAALYNYTPYIRGNKLFWQIWQNWFVNSTSSLNGLLVRAKSDKGVWLIQDNKRRPFYSKSVFLASHRFENVHEISREELERYEIGEPMKFPNYSLLKGSSGDIFLIIDNIKRKIASPKIFREIGFNPEEVTKVEDFDLAQYPDGGPIVTPYPAGALLQDEASGAIFFVQDEIKYPVVSELILNNNFPYNKIIKVGPDKLDDFIYGEPVKFSDGTLIKEAQQPTVYVVAQGKKLPIASVETFEALGYRWENIITVPETILSIHNLGETLDINNM